MTLKDYTDIMRPILDLYDECDYEGAVILSRKQLLEASSPEISLLLEAFESHCQGYSRWESSYDYSMARDNLHEANRSIDKAITICEGTEQDIFKLLAGLNGVVEAAISLENALISVDPPAMARIAASVVDLSCQSIEIAEDSNRNDCGLVQWFLTEFLSWKVYGTGVSAYGKAMSALRTPEFPDLYREAEHTIMDCLQFLEEEGDEDTYTELTAYLEFLRRHAEVASEHSEFLVLKDNKLTWLYNFWGEQEFLNKIYERLLDNHQDFTEEMAAHGMTIETVDEDSISDLFETVLGAERMKNLAFNMSPVTLSFRGEDIEIQLSVRIYRYGVGTIYLESDVDELTVSDLRVYLSFNGPHSAEYDIQWEGREYKRLNVLAKDIVSTLNSVFALFVPQTNLRFVPHLNWYACVLIQRGLWARGKQEDRKLSLREASALPDYGGLLLGQMEARAALDDWILREPLKVRNLAPIRSHTSDLLATTENHGVLWFPDDPYWIILQYQETIETAVRLRCLISTLIAIAGEILHSFIEETTDLAQEIYELDLDVAENRISEIRGRLLPVIHFDTMAHMNIELISGALTSNYRDHAELMQEMIDDLNIDRMVDYLERRLDILSHHQTLFSDIAANVVERRVKEAERKQAELDSRRTHAMEFVELFISVLAIGEVAGYVFNAIQGLGYIINPAVESATYFIGVIVMFIVIAVIRRGWFLNKNSA